MMRHGMVIFKIYGDTVLSPVEHWDHGSEYFHPNIIPQCSDVMIRVVSGDNYGSIIKNRYGPISSTCDPLNYIPKNFYIMLRYGRPGLPLSVIHERFEYNEYCTSHTLLPFSTELVSPNMLVDFVYSVSI